MEFPANTVGFISCRHSLSIQLMKAIVLTESSILYFIFSPNSLHYGDVYKCESGRCLTLPLFSTFVFISPSQVFSKTHMENRNKKRIDLISLQWRSIQKDFRTITNSMHDNKMFLPYKGTYKHSIKMILQYKLVDDHAKFHIP